MIKLAGVVLLASVSAASAQCQTEAWNPQPVTQWKGTLSGSIGVDTPVIVAGSIGVGNSVPSLYPTDKFVSGPVVFPLLPIVAKDD